MDVTKNFLWLRWRRAWRDYQGKKIQDFQLHLPYCPTFTCTKLYDSPPFKPHTCGCNIFGVFRSWKIDSCTGNSVANIINWSDIRFSNDNSKMFVTIRHSNNNQYGTGFTICIEKSSSIDCLIRYYTFMLNFFAVILQVSSSLFCFFNGSPLTRYQFTSVLTIQYRSDPT